VDKYGLQVKSLVSDRASALIKLGSPEYLNVVSMPDLFHFSQDLSKTIGFQIGKKREQAHKALAVVGDNCKKNAQSVFEHLDGIRKSYRQQIEQINKTVHPLNEEDQWTDEAAVEKGLLHCLTSIGRLAKQLDIEPGLKKIQKILTQISPIAQGVQGWIEGAKSELDEWLSSQLITKQEQQWIIQYAFAYVYWDIQLIKTQAKLQNRDLRTYYKSRMEQARQKGITADLTKDISEQRQQYLFTLAHQLAISFHRSSSQVEGRNGYLSFVNHANRGIGKQRLQALTVIHNFDIKRIDGTTPAQRLFKKDFPDLFEFLCEKVTGFKEPRRTKDKSLKISFVLH